MIINPYAVVGPVDKLVTLKTKSGEKVSAEFTISDDKGRQSAAEYIQHLFEGIQEKLNEPVIYLGAEKPNPDSLEALTRQILYIASFHDAMFGTFGRQSKLPEDERKEFIEIFLLACATLLEGKNILLDLEKGKISDETRLN